MSKESDRDDLKISINSIEIKILSDLQETCSSVKKRQDTRNNEDQSEAQQSCSF